MDNMTAAQKVLKWMNEYYELNGTPNFGEISAQLEMAIDEESKLKNNGDLGDVVGQSEQFYCREVENKTRFRCYRQCDDCKKCNK